jgi:hypothetical protein
MTERNRRQPDRDVPTYSPHTGSFDDDPTDEGMWSEEELERARMGWRADDEQEEPATSVPSNAPHVGDLDADVDDLDETLSDAADAIEDMAAREMRRDQSHRTGGDDLNPGFDSDVDSNAPKDADRPAKKGGGSRNKSDWH